MDEIILMEFFDLLHIISFGGVSSLLYLQCVYEIMFLSVRGGHKRHMGTWQHEMLPSYFCFCSCLFPFSGEKLRDLMSVCFGREENRVVALMQPYFGQEYS